MIKNNMLGIALFLMPNSAYAKSGVEILSLAVLFYALGCLSSILFAIQLIISGIAAIFATPGTKRKIFFKTLVLFLLAWLILCVFVALRWLPLYMLVMVMIISAIILWCIVVFIRVKKEKISK